MYSLVPGRVTAVSNLPTYLTTYLPTFHRIKGPSLVVAARGLPPGPTLVLPSAPCRPTTCYFLAKSSRRLSFSLLLPRFELHCQSELHSLSMGPPISIDDQSFRSTFIRSDFPTCCAISTQDKSLIHLSISNQLIRNLKSRLRRNAA